MGTPKPSPGPRFHRAGAPPRQGRLPLPNPPRDCIPWNPAAQWRAALGPAQRFATLGTRPQGRAAPDTPQCPRFRALHPFFLPGDQLIGIASRMGAGQAKLPEFHPQTVLRDWGNGQAFRLADALTGVCVFGATGSGKTSGPAKHLAYGYLAAGFGGLVLAPKRRNAASGNNGPPRLGAAMTLSSSMATANGGSISSNGRPAARRKAAA